MPATLLAFGLLLLLPLWNGYAFLTQDSANYLATALYGAVHPHQPPFYGAWVGLTSGRISLWGTVLAQTALAAWLCSSFLHSRRSAIALFVLASPVAWYTSQIMADAFTGIGILALTRLLFSRQPLRWIDSPVAGTVLAYALFHFSHWQAALVALLVATPFLLSRGYTHKARVLLATGVLLSPLLLTPLANRFLSGSFFLERSSEAFLVGRLFETDIVEKLHQSHCRTDEKLPFCDTLAQAPQALSGSINFFLWHPISPHQRVPGPERVRRYRHLLKRALVEYPVVTLQTFTGGFVKQLVFFASGDSLGVWEGDAGPLRLLASAMPWDRQSFAASRQQNRRLPLVAMNYFYFGVIVLSLAVFFRRRHSWTAPLCFVLGSVVANALVCGFWTGGFYRYGGRAIWLVPLIALKLAFEKAYSCEATPRSFGLAAVSVAGSLSSIPKFLARSDKRRKRESESFT